MASPTGLCTLRLQVAAALCASYIGGSVNFAAVAQALSLAPGPLLAGEGPGDERSVGGVIRVLCAVTAHTQVSFEGM